jgi:hypothetical protein
MTAFAKGRPKTGGRKKGARNKRTLAAEPKVYPNSLDHLAAVMAATDDPSTTPELRLRAAIALAQYQHPKPAPSRFLNPIDYTPPQSLEEARAAFLELGQRLMQGKIPLEAHDVLIDGIKAYLSDVTAEQEKRLTRLEDLLRHGEQA